VQPRGLAGVAAAGLPDLQVELRNPQGDCASLACRCKEATMRSVVACLVAGLAACSGVDGVTTSALPVAAPPAAAAPRIARVDRATLEHTRAALGELGRCRSELGCEAFDVLLDLGDAAAPETLAFVADRSRGGDVRRLAARALGRLHVASAGPQLVALANTEPDVMVQIDLFKAAGACGGAATFDALAFEYDREQPGAPGEHLVALRDGLRAFHDRALGWALAAMTKAGPAAAKYADIVCDVATLRDRDVVVGLIGKTGSYAADDRLAAKALALGATDDRLYDTLLAGLASETPGDRADAAAALRVVAKQLPEVRRAKAVTLLKKAIARTDPAMVSGLEASLAKLGS
jgi:hypothetical protein